MKREKEPAQSQLAREVVSEWPTRSVRPNCLRLCEKRIFGWMMLTLLAINTSRAAVSPMDAPLEEGGKANEITVKYDGKPVQVGKFTLKPAAGEYHYNLFLPPDYNKDPKELFPLLFIQSPGGGSAMGKMKPRMTKDRFVVIGLVEAKNGPWEPIIADFCASHDDVIKRCRIAEGFKFMTGFSGGGRSSTFMPDLRPGFIGCFPQGAGVWPEYAQTPHNPNVAMFVSMGGNDGNIKELPGLHKLLPPKMAFTMVFHAGGHGNAPEDVVEQGWDWLEWWAYFGSPTQSAAKPMYTQYFNKLADDAETADGDFAKYELLESADKIASGRNLTNNKDVAAKLLKVKKSMADLAKTDAVKKELPARTAFQKVVDNEYSARRQAKGDYTVHRHFMGEVSKLYADVAKKYPGTAYGEKATAAATRTKAEADLANSTKEKGGQSD